MDENRDRDPVFALLDRLPAIRGNPAHDARVRQRCHALIATRRHHRERLAAGRSTAARVTDLVLAGAAGVYLLVSLAAAAQILTG